MQPGERFRRTIGRMTKNHLPRWVASTLGALALVVLVLGCGIDAGTASDACSGSLGSAAATTASGGGAISEHTAKGAADEDPAPRPIAGGTLSPSAEAPALGIVVPLVPGLGLDAYSRNCDLFDDPYGACL